MYFQAVANVVISLVAKSLLSLPANAASLHNNNNNNYNNFDLHITFQGTQGHFSMTMT